ncbi:MAG: hypothetical protein QOE81_1805 [Verrucomicrobiota bacterium]
MSASFSSFTRVITFVGGLVLAGGQLFGGEIVSTETSPVYSRNIARFSIGARIDDNLAQVALISEHPTFGYTLPDGNSELVLSLSKIENFDVISFVNQGTTGTVTVSTSNSKLAAGSSQWHQIAKQDLTAKVTKMNVGPTEAKYVKFTFHVANSGKIAQLAVYSNAKLTIANTALAGGSEAGVDGKDAKDFGGGKDAKEVAEGPPEEGPPPTLPDPPPFVFVPLVSE